MPDLNSTPSEQGWQAIETRPDADIFVAAIKVRDNRSGAEWWERHLIALDDETGEIHADYDQGWQIADYEWWLPFKTPPLPPPSGAPS